MADSTMRALYNIGGGVPLTLSYPIASSEAWSVGSVVGMNSAGALLEVADDSSDVWGLTLESVTAGAATGPITDLCAVTPFTYGVVYATKETTSLDNTPVAADIGEIRDLDLDGTNGWGIHASSSATSNTPTFRIVDIDTIRNEWHIVIAPLELTDVFQWIDAAV